MVYAFPHNLSIQAVLAFGHAIDFPHTANPPIGKCPWLANDLLTRNPCNPLDGSSGHVNVSQAIDAKQI